MKPPVIVVPGITATSLSDTYPSETEPIWGIVHRDYRRVALHPDDLRYEEREPARVMPAEAFSIPYNQLVEELRHDLSPAEDQPRPVYLWGHDWRQPVRRLVDQLDRFIDEVIARTALLRHYHKAKYTKENGTVDLVGHSMGGLIITGLLAREAEKARVRKVATIGTPYLGSFEAVIKVITGTAELGSGMPSSREREVARITPALYHLIPRWKDALDLGPGLSGTLFDAALWQPGVIQSIAEHIRVHALQPPRAKRALREEGRKLLQSMLTDAKRFSDDVDGFELDASALAADDWLAIVGLGENTRCALRIEETSGGPFFVLQSLERKNGYPEPVERDGKVVAELVDTGDGTVPYAGAKPPFLDTDKIVAVSDEDFGYWELADRFIQGIAGLHGLLPGMNLVIKLCAAFLQGEAGARATAPRGLKARRAPDLVPPKKWDPPLTGLVEEKPAVFQALSQEA